MVISVLAVAMFDLFSTNFVHTFNPWTNWTIFGHNPTLDKFVDHKNAIISPPTCGGDGGFQTFWFSGTQ